MKRVVLIRSNPIAPDPPVEKAANSLLANGYDVTLLGWDRGSDIPESVDKVSLPAGNVKIVRFGIPAFFGGGFKKNIRPLLRYLKQLSRWLKQHSGEYDIIHSFDFDTGMVAAKAAKKYRKKFVYHILDFYIHSHRVGNAMMRKIFKRAEFKVINGADATIICTEKRRDQIVGSHPKKLVIIHNTPMAAACTEKEEFPASDCLRIAYVGIFGGYRMLPELLSVVQKDERFELHIGGFGNMEDKIREAADACPRIVYYGRIPYAKTLALESACDIMTAIYDPVLLNHRYAAPNKFYESLMLGKPVVMARNTGFDDAVEKYGIGTLIDECTEEGLLTALEDMLARRNEWEAMGQRSKNLYEKEYSWAIMEERLLALYKELEK